MEGTRHEKIAIIIAAYIIGFTTAFIAFGVNQPKNPIEPLQVTARNQQVDTKESLASNVITSVGYSNEGLFAVTAGYERLLSAKASTLGASAIASGGTSGYYFKIIDAEASRDGRFVYFCEQLTQDSKTCDPYVYAIEDDSLHPVKADDVKYQSPVATHESAWSDANELVLNGMISSEKDSPWLLVSNKSESDASFESGDAPQVQ